jgi:drug/metabolite transporter (DMT)-like permease
MKAEDAEQGAFISWAGIALVNLATLSWATNLNLARWIKDDIGPLTLTALRFTVASLIFGALLSRAPEKERRYGKDFWLLLGMSLSGVALFSPMIYWGLHYTTAANAALINGLAPLFTVLWGFLLIQESLTPREIWGAVLAFLGVIVLLCKGSLSYLVGFKINPGDLLVLGAVALWGLYSVLGRRVMKKSGRSALSATALSAYLGLALLWACAAWEMFILPAQLSLKLIAAVVYIGIAPTVIGYVAWNAGVRRLGAFGAMIFYNTLPLYGASLGFFLLGEHLTPAHLAGGALIIAGGIWAARKS